MIDTIIEERFRIDERLVKQGFVELFKGIDLEHGQTVWLKRITEPLNEDLDFIGNWRAQLLSLHDLSIPGIPQILAFGRTQEDELYQVETPPPGGTLRRHTSARAPLAVPEAVNLVAAVSRTVGTVHREGIAHGALSPENIYIGEDEEGRPQPFVTGWEMGEIVIATREGGHALPDRLARYLAPEQLTHPIPPATAASDVYTLALILYELLTGSFPTTNTDNRIESDPTPPGRYNPEIPGTVERVLLRALSRDPAARPPNGLALASGLTEALQYPEPAPPPPPVTERTERVTFRQPPWLPAALLAALLLICALFALLLWGDGEEIPTAQEADATTTAQARLIPNLLGPPPVRYNEAVSLAWNEGFQVSIVEFVEDPDIAPGAITAQCPAPGTLPGDTGTNCPNFETTPATTDTILVKVGSLPEPVVLRVVPDLYGQSEEAAREALEAGGLRVGTRRIAYDLLIERGKIIEQNPRRGLAVLPGTSVDIIVSAGPPTGQDVQPTPPPQIQPDLPSQETPTEPSLPQEAPTEPAGYLPPETATPLPEPAMTPSPSPTQTPVDSSIPDEEQGEERPLLEDDFEEGNDLGWAFEESEAVTSTIESGVFRVEATEPDLFWMSHPGRLFADFTYSATFTLQESSGGEDGDGGAGIVFRIQDDQHFYFFEINNDGAFRLRARDGDEWFSLLNWSNDPTIQPPGEENQLRVSAEGERLRLFINGTQMAVADIPQEVMYSSGSIGIGVQVGTDPVRVEFDRIELSR